MLHSAVPSGLGGPVAVPSGAAHAVLSSGSALAEGDEAFLSAAAGNSASVRSGGGGPGASLSLPRPSVVDEARLYQYEREIEGLQAHIAAQEERVSKMTWELQASKKSERQALTDLEASRQEVVRLNEELRSEREARLQAETLAGEAGRQQLSTTPPPAATKPRGPVRQQGPRRALSQSRRDPDAGLKSGASTAVGSSATPPFPSDGRSGDTATPNGLLTGSTATSGRRSGASGTAGAGGERTSNRSPARAKDEIDARLAEYLDKTPCNLCFRRLNRGWYAFRRADETKAFGSSDRSAEIMVVNGKLMARLEATHTDKGWNNGKLGTIERFCAHFATCEPAS